MIQHSFEIIIDGVTKWRQENNNPRTLSNVKVWASRGRHGFPPADAYIKHLEYENMVATTTTITTTTTTTATTTGLHCINSLLPRIDIENR